MPTLPRLIEEDICQLDGALHELLLKSDATAALVIDRGGFVITKCGDHDQFDTMTLAALCAASFAATESIASLVNEKNFSSVYQQGENYSLLVINVDEYCLLTIIFKATISVGAVKYFSPLTIVKVAGQMKIALARTPDEGLDLSVLNVADPSGIFRMKTA